MPIPQLNVRSISCSPTPPAAASQLKTGRTGTRARSMARRGPVGQHARNVFGKSAAGDVGERLDRLSSRGRGEARIARRCASASSNASPRLSRRLERRRRVPSQSGVGDNAAHQRKAVGVHAGGGEADHHVARRDIVARQRAAALDGADGKAGEIVVAVPDRCPAFPPSRRRSARSPLAGSRGDALDDRRADLRVELAAGEVVEEEQRLGALDHEIVDATWRRDRCRSCRGGRSRSRS